jgi:hypothetical protein
MPQAPPEGAARKRKAEDPPPLLQSKPKTMVVRPLAKSTVQPTSRYGARMLTAFAVLDKRMKEEGDISTLGRTIELEKTAAEADVSSSGSTGSSTAMTTHLSEY